MAVKVVCYVRRRDPACATGSVEARGGQGWDCFEVEVEEGSTVLDVLRAISRQDPTLAHTTHHCKTGICGGCTLQVNGRQRLACRTLASEHMRLEPAPGLPLIKDLLVDLLPLQRKGLPQRREAH